MHSDDKLFAVRRWRRLHGVLFTNLLSNLEGLQTTRENCDNQRNPATDYGALFTLQFDFSKGYKQVLPLRSQPLTPGASRKRDSRSNSNP